MRNGPARLAMAVDAALAAGFAMFVVFGTVGASTLQGNRPRPLDVWAFLLVVVAAVAAVSLRRLAPVWALAGTMAAVSAYLMAGYPYGPVQLCMVVAMFEVARQRPPRVSLLACGLAAAAASVTILVRLVGEVHAPLALALAWMGWIVLPWSLGALVHVRTVASVRARRDLVARGALEERMRIASEVHDVAGHGFAVIAMQAGVALLTFDEQPDQARRSLEAIRETSATSLASLRGMLDTFHPGEHGMDALAGPGEDAGLAGLGELLDRVRAGGLPVMLEWDTMDTVLPGDVDTAAYRVVQESLTNVLRHAGPTKAEVRIVRRDDELLVQVLDRGRGGPQTRPYQGRGLTGMRRRVESVGGHLEAGPREGGGFRVAARLPLAGGVR